MPIEDLDALRAALKKRGFKMDDPLLHDCPDCGVTAIERYRIASRHGGRDITLCQACGRSRSWRSAPGLETREEDKTFDLRAFLA
jgi:hypothetical protein